MPHVLDTLKREPALAFTLAYLLVALAGIYFNVSYYDEFGIPILTLSQISDYLVAGLQRPMALVLALSTFPLVWGIDRLNGDRRRRDARVAAKRCSAAVRRRAGIVRECGGTTGRAGLPAAVICSSCSFTAGCSSQSMRTWKPGMCGRAGPIKCMSDSMRRDADPHSVDLSQPVVYLGAVADYVFVYDPRSKRSAVLPVNNISRIEPINAGPDNSQHALIAPNSLIPL